MSENKHRNKSSCSESNLVQSSRSKLTMCQRKGLLLRFQSTWNSTNTSDGGEQKLGKYLWQWLARFWIDCNQKFAAKTVANEIQCLQAIVETCIDWTGFDFFIHQVKMRISYWIFYWIMRSRNLSGLDIGFQVEQSQNEKPACKIGSSLQNTMIIVWFIYHFFQRFKTKAQWLRQVLVSPVTCVQFMLGAETLCSRQWP